jgi:uncharacterized protein (TIGR03083 family)
MSAHSAFANTNFSAKLSDAARIAPLTRAEIDSLAREEWKRLLAFLETLDTDDWQKPTMCTAWTVRDMTAHQAGAYAAYASFQEFRRQYLNLPPKGRLPEDVINEIQIADRQHKTNAELISEIRERGPRTIANRQRIPFFLRAVSFPRPDGTKLYMSYMLDVIYTRDTWMHRVDLARATNREMKLTREHDGRIVELVMRDVNALLAPKVGADSIVMELTGIAGGAWRIGKAAAPRATISMDALHFNIYASGRYTYAQALTSTVLSGDRAFAENALKHISVLY